MLTRSTRDPSRLAIGSCDHARYRLQRIRGNRMTELLFLPWRHLTRAEQIGVGALLLIFVVWAVLPAIPQDPGYHLFADQRQWLGIPHTANVLSNAAFVLAGLYGIARLAHRDRAAFHAATEAGLGCLALGLVCTGLGSAWYHLNP